jgi:hypothetical protein
MIAFFINFLNYGKDASKMISRVCFGLLLSAAIAVPKISDTLREPDNSPHKSNAAMRKWMVICTSEHKKLNQGYVSPIHSHSCFGKNICTAHWLRALSGPIQ